MEELYEFFKWVISDKLRFTELYNQWKKESGLKPQASELPSEPLFKDSFDGKDHTIEPKS